MFAAPLGELKCLSNNCFTVINLMPIAIFRYVCAAFPSACGKTNLAMLQPTLEGYDISW